MKYLKRLQQSEEVRSAKRLTFLVAKQHESFRAQRTANRLKRLELEADEYDMLHSEGLTCKGLVDLRAEIKELKQTEEDISATIKELF